MEVVMERKSRQKREEGRQGNKRSERKYEMKKCESERVMEERLNRMAEVESERKWGDGEM